MSMSAPVASHAPVHPALEDEEWHFIRKMREIPPSPLRDRMTAVLDALLDFVAEPGCPLIQADGVPCKSAQMSCDRCSEVLGLLDELHHRIRHA